MFSSITEKKSKASSNLDRGFDQGSRFTSLSDEEVQNIMKGNFGDPGGGGDEGASDLPPASAKCGLTQVCGTKIASKVVENESDAATFLVAAAGSPPPTSNRFDSPLTGEESMGRHLISSGS